MGTRSAVFYKTKKGDFKGSYIHYDGYIEGVGIILQTHYRDKEVIKKLVDASSCYHCLERTVKRSLRENKRSLITPPDENSHYRAGTLEDILSCGEESALEYIYVFLEDGFLVSYEGFKEFYLLEDLIAEIKP